MFTVSVLVDGITERLIVREMAKRLYLVLLVYVVHMGKQPPLK